MGGDSNSLGSEFGFKKVDVWIYWASGSNFLSNPAARFLRTNRWEPNKGRDGGLALGVRPPNLLRRAARRIYMQLVRSQGRPTAFHPSSSLAVPSSSVRVPARCGDCGARDGCGEAPCGNRGSLT